MPPALRLSEWADQHFYLSSESSGTEGNWQTLPYQRGMMDIIGGDYVRTVTIRKSARVGYTKMIVAASAYWTTYKRRTGAIWQPTDSDAQEFKKDEINAALRDVPVWGAAMLAPDPETKSKHNTEDRVAFHGSTLYIRGGKAARNYRRLTLDFAIIDEFDGFDQDIEGEGSADWLADKRLAASPFPKAIRGSTPLEQNSSQIERSESEADLQLVRQLPCPECGEFHHLEWKHFHYEKTDPLKTARFACPHCGSLYGYDSYAAMDAAGRWATADGSLVFNEDDETLVDADDQVVEWPRHVAMHIWGGYSYLVSWGDIAHEWHSANEVRKRTGSPLPLKSFVNLTLGESWRERDSAIDGEALFARRESYAAEVPAGVMVLTMGVDTQDDRLEFEVVGHGKDSEKWGIRYGVLHGDPADGEVWDQLDRELERAYQHESGGTLRVMACGIDTGGHRTHHVYEYCRPRWTRKVYALKGQGGEGVPSTRPPSKVKFSGTRTIKLYNIGVDAWKSRWFDWLKRKPGQVGYQHFPEAYSMEWCEQATGEFYDRKLIRGRWHQFWKKLRARVEGLDCRVYALAAFEVLNPRLELMAEQPDSDTPPDDSTDKPSPRRRRRSRGRGFVSRYRG